jgi:RNA polymerase sigma-70 factor (ECF subfamily)
VTDSLIPVRDALMAHSPDDLSALLARVRLGDEAALAELVRSYEPEVRLTARVLLGRAMRASLDSVDLVQSVHRTLMEGLRDNKLAVSNPQQLLGLAVTLLRRKIAHHWRRLQRQHPLDEEAVETGNLDQVVTSPWEGGPDPALQAAYNDAVNHLFSKLDDQDRRVVQMRLQGYSTAEVARRLGLDADVLRVRLSRLRRRLREEKVLTEWL